MGQAASNALEPLRAMQSDPEEYVRAAVAEAIAAIEKDKKPWWKFW
jgi:hypothetical protein